MAINWKRLLAGLLASATLVGSMLTLGSCGNNNEGTAGETKGEKETISSDSAYGSLEKIKYNKEFVIYQRDGGDKSDFEVEKITGDVLDDAIYDRNSIVSQDYGITFEYYENSYDKIDEDLKKQIEGGLQDYDLYVGHM